MSRPDSKNADNYFTMALICTVLVLYSFSIYSYFESPQLHADVLPAAYAEQFENDIQLTNTLTAETKAEDRLFRPINSDTTSFIPGTECILTDRNFTPAGTFQMLPSDCKFSVEED